MKAQSLVIDARGVVRARLGIKGSDTIELDLFDRTGTIRVKLGAGDEGSGLVMGDGTEPTAGTSLRETGPAPAGRPQLISH